MNNPEQDLIKEFKALVDFHHLEPGDTVHGITFSTPELRVLNKLSAEDRSVIFLSRTEGHGKLLKVEEKGFQVTFLFGK